MEHSLGIRACDLACAGMIRAKLSHYQMWLPVDWIMRYNVSRYR